MLDRLIGLFIFINHHLRHVPVVRENFLLGVVSRGDVLRSLDDYYRNWIRAREHDRQPIDVHEIMNHRFLFRNGARATLGLGRSADAADQLQNDGLQNDNRSLETVLTSFELA